MKLAEALILIFAPSGDTMAQKIETSSNRRLSVAGNESALGRDHSNTLIRISAPLVRISGTYIAWPRTGSA